MSSPSRAAASAVGGTSADINHRAAAARAHLVTKISPPGLSLDANAAASSDMRVTSPQSGNALAHTHNNSSCPLVQPSSGENVVASPSRLKIPPAAHAQVAENAVALSQPQHVGESGPDPPGEVAPSYSLPHLASEADITTAMLTGSPSKGEAKTAEKVVTPTAVPAPKEAPTLSPTLSSDCAPVPPPPTRPRSPFMALARLLPSSNRSSMSAVRSPSQTPRSRHQSMPTTIRPQVTTTEAIPGLPFSQNCSGRASQPSSFSSGDKLIENEEAGVPVPVNRPEEIPFDFNLFLEQMRQPCAASVGEYVKSFVRDFSRRPHRLNDQVQLVRRFLSFMDEQMAQTPPWSQQTPAELWSSREGLEKLIMNRLYPFTFAPAVAAAGRPVRTDDLERDAVLNQKVRLFGWVKEAHLDLPLVPQSHGFVTFAMRELLKINQFKAPRDKLICILNVCKVIFGLIRHLRAKEAGADTFLPLLILVILRAQCPNLVSNVEYIAHFRSPERLSSESGYYLSSLQGAIGFIEQMGYSSLTNIPVEEFECQIEAAATELSAKTRQPHPSQPLKKESTDTLPLKPQPSSFPLSGPTCEGKQTKLPSSDASHSASIQQSEARLPANSSGSGSSRSSPRTAELARLGMAGLTDSSHQSWNESIESVPELQEESFREADSKDSISIDAIALSQKADLERPSQAIAEGTQINVQHKAEHSVNMDKQFTPTDQQSQPAVKGKSSSKRIGSPLWSRLFTDANTPLPRPQTGLGPLPKEAAFQENESLKEKSPKEKQEARVRDAENSSTDQVWPAQDADSRPGMAAGSTFQADRAPLSLWDRSGRDQSEGSSGSQPSAAPIARNRLLSLFTDGPPSSDPAYPGPQDLAFSTLGQGGQASSLKLPLPNWALSAMRRKSSGEPAAAITAEAPASTAEVPASTVEAPASTTEAPASSTLVSSSTKGGRESSPPGRALTPAPPDEEATAAWASESEAKAESLARAQEQEQTNVATLASMFPLVDPLVCQLVLENCRGDLQASIGKLMAMD